MDTICEWVTEGGTGRPEEERCRGSALIFKTRGQAFQCADKVVVQRWFIGLSQQFLSIVIYRYMYGGGGAPKV